MDQAAWTRRAKVLVADLEAPTLALFLSLGGARLANAADASRSVVYQRAVRQVIGRLVHKAAALRGLVAAQPDILVPDRVSSCWLSDDPPTILGVAHENLLGRLPRFLDGKWLLSSSHQRRTSGVFFTPPSMVRYLTERALAARVGACSDVAAVLALRVVDPSVGTGFFLVAALDLLAAAVVERDPSICDAVARQRVAKHCLYGVDVDPDAVALAQQLLWLSIGSPAADPSRCVPGLHVGDALLGPGVDVDAPSLAHWAASTGISQDVGFSWRERFCEVFEAGGFDAVVGNPPWGRIRPDLKGFHLHHDARVSDMQGTQLRDHLTAAQDERVAAAWRAHRERWLAYGRRLASSGTYSAQRVQVDGRTTRGDADAYKYFLERSWHLLRDGGRLAMVIPAAFTRSEGATGLRRLFLEHGETEELLSFENRAKHFPIHGMFRYALFVWRKGGVPGARKVLSGLVDSGALHSLDHSATPAMSLDWLRRVGGSRLTIPAVRTRAEQELYERLLRTPVLGETREPWSVHFVRELDMTRDRDRFLGRDALVELGFEREGTSWRHRTRGVARPLYEGRMVHQHDHAAKAYLGGAGRKANWKPLAWTDKRIEPHYWVVTSELADGGASIDHPRAGFCDITGHANERTALAALIPAGHPCGNKVPTVRFDRDDPRLSLLWVAIANSLVVGWVLRRLLDTTLNFFHWRQVPFPRLDPDSPDGEALWTRAWRLAGAAPGHHDSGLDPIVPVADASERATVRAEIDAIVAQAFGLVPADLRLILDDFPLLDRHQPALPGERQSTITADLAMLSLFERQGPGTRAGVATARHRVAQSRALGGVAYVPAELARQMG